MSPGSANDGYEAWIVVDAGNEPAGEAKILDIEGGLYAVTRCVVPKGLFDTIGSTWRRLVTRREDTGFRCGRHQCLKESPPLSLPDAEFVLDLYLAIASLIYSLGHARTPCSAKGLLSGQT